MTRRTPSEWLTLVQEFEQSGLTQTAFCAQHAINPKYFSLRRTKLLAKSRATAFVAAAVPDRLPDNVMATLHYGKVSLQIPVHHTQVIIPLMKALA